ncbi:MAG: ATP synthase F1 subunit epsilon [Prevotella sp.]|nr:ATP synthase F1 subunit epsilon [Prevotella sp.]MBO5205739.1 ATP synthase F1 subunit epsilon [Prevotella sp.]MDO5525713.1 ATP synthase F1 subunit epsilon [Prevotella sp.]
MGLHLRIVSPVKVEYDGEVESIVVPGTQGQFEILKDHAPIISSLEEGTVVYRIAGGNNIELAILGGFVEVQKNVVSLCVEI